MYAGDPPCGLLNSAGKLAPPDVAALTGIIASYEAEQARVCAEFATCQTDRGAPRTLAHSPALVSSDYNHLNVAGLAAFAAREWPVVQAALQEGTPG